MISLQSTIMDDGLIRHTNAEASLVAWPIARCPRYDRQSVSSTYCWWLHDLLSNPPDVMRSKEVFQRHCTVLITLHIQLWF